MDSRLTRLASVLLVSLRSLVLSFFFLLLLYFFGFWFVFFMGLHLISAKTSFAQKLVSGFRFAFILYAFLSFFLFLFFSFSVCGFLTVVIMFLSCFCH